MNVIKKLLTNILIYGTEFIVIMLSVPNRMGGIILL